MSELDWVSRLGCRRILIVGDLMLDRYIWGQPERVSPEAPVLVLREDLDEVRPGGAANVASFLRHLGATPILAGIVGDDAEGRTLCRLMSELSVDLQCIVTDPDRVTTAKQRFVGRAAQRQPHQILRVDREAREPIGNSLECRLIELTLRELSACDAVLISDYAKGVCTPRLLRTVIEAARAQEIPVLVDPCRGVDYARYAGATLVAPNRVAAELECGRVLRDSESVRCAVQELRERLQIHVAVLTLDRDGLAYASADDTGLVPCRPREVCDVTGAGDMVLAVLGLCTANRVPLLDSLRIANAAAGLEVERFGVEPVSRAELALELSPSHESGRKAVAIGELLRMAAGWRQSHRTVVLANGCFDLLHVGHVSLLEQAACLGEVLVVAINSDESIRKLKGNERPVIGQQDRVRMLSALSCVDAVIVFDEETPIPLLQRLRPEVLVKGAEYGPHDVVGADVVTEYGGSVVTIPMIPGFSTTQLLEGMKDRTSFRSNSDSDTSAMARVD